MLSKTADWKTLAVALACGVTLSWYTYGWLTRPPEGVVGQDTPATRYAIAHQAKRLDDIAARGDIAAAVGMLDDTTRLMRMLNDSPVVSRPDMRNCLLAAMHLSNGVASVMDGGGWTSRGRYEAALSYCR